MLLEPLCAKPAPAGGLGAAGLCYILQRQQVLLWKAADFKGIVLHTVTSFKYIIIIHASPNIKKSSRSVQHMYSTRTCTYMHGAKNVHMQD